MLSKILTGSILVLGSISAMAQDFFIGNEEIEKNGMPMVARSISGSMAGMSGTVTINLVKLSNGSYLYETTNQNDEAIEFNKRLCEMYGDKNPESPGKMVIGSDERNIPLHCEPASLQKEISFKQQIVLAYESIINVFDDAGNGSYYIENITQQFAEKSWKSFLEMEENGGYSKLLKTGWIQQKIYENAVEEQQWVEEGKIKLIGVNFYPKLEKTKSVEELYNSTKIVPVRLSEMYE